MSITIFQIGLLTAGITFLIGGGVLAVIASRVASRGRAAQADADIRLAASKELAVEVKRLAEKVEQSLAARDTAIENAFLRHNDACMASVQSTMATQASGGHGHDDDDDDHHKKKHHASAKGGHGHDDDDDDHHKKKHHAALKGGHGHDDDDDDDHHKKKHHALFKGGHGHDDDDDDHHKKKHHAANDERPSLMARLFRRYP